MQRYKQTIWKNLPNKLFWIVERTAWVQKQILEFY